MTAEELAAYCLAKPGAWEDEPWEGDTVAKVHDTPYDLVVSRIPKKHRPQGA